MLLVRRERLQRERRRLVRVRLGLGLGLGLGLVLGLGVKGNPNPNPNQGGLVLRRKLGGVRHRHNRRGQQAGLLDAEHLSRVRARVRARARVRVRVRVRARLGLGLGLGLAAAGNRQDSLMLSTSVPARTDQRAAPSEETHLQAVKREAHL